MIKIRNETRLFTLRAKGGDKGQLEILLKQYNLRLQDEMIINGASGAIRVEYTEGEDELTFAVSGREGEQTRAYFINSFSRLTLPLFNSGYEMKLYRG